jgi:hypothetical protein
MLERTALAVVVVLVLAQSARAEMIPTVAMPAGWNPLRHPEIAGCMGWLLARSQFGEGDEQAAFIVLGDDGRFACLPWRDNDAHSHGARYKGRIPQGTVAVAHTHPVGLTEPSRQDRKEADRLDVPFIVVSPGSVTMARPREEGIVDLNVGIRAAARVSSELSRFRP